MPIVLDGIKYRPVAGLPKKDKRVSECRSFPNPLGARYLHCRRRYNRFEPLVRLWRWVGTLRPGNETAEQYETEQQVDKKEGRSGHFWHGKQ